MALRHIEIEEDDFARLQTIAVPFIDTPASVVGKLLDKWEGRERGQISSTTTGGSGNSTIYGPDAIPPLTHAKLMFATFGGDQPDKATWDGLVLLALLKAKANYGSVDEVRRVSGANVTAGRRTVDGYKPVEGQGFSYQGLSAEDALKVVIRCARALRCSLTVEFVWRDKKGAHRPGERGRIELIAR